MNFASLRKELEGELLTDDTTRRLYATDASAYREIPVAVALWSFRTAIAARA